MHTTMNNQSIRGIHNVSGVACHLSCGLLILCYNLVPLRDALIHLAECHPQKQSSHHLLRLGHLLREMTNKDEEEAVDPSKFFSSFQNQCNAYDLGDASRALSVLLGTIRSLFQGTDDTDAFQKSRYQLQSLYELLLLGTKEQIIIGRRCLDGKRIVRRKRKEAPLSMPFPIDCSKESVNEAIAAALEPSPIKGYNWDNSRDYEETIEDCGTNLDSEWKTTKEFKFLSLPATLLLYLQRFEYRNDRVEAKQHTVTVTSTLDIPCNTGDTRYHLVGGILHADEADREEDYEGGHYTTLLLTDNQWTLVDGEHVINISTQKALDLLSGKPGASDNGPTRGMLLNFSRQLSTDKDMSNTLLDKFRESLSVATSRGNYLFPVNPFDPQNVLGKRIKIRWSGGKFYGGKVVAYNESSGKHKVEYDDGDVKEYRLHKKTVEWQDRDLQSEWTRKYYS